MAEQLYHHPLQNRIKAFYDDRAPRYDTEPDGFHLRLAHDYAKEAQQFIPSELASPVKMLDLCCGTGMVTLAALKLYGPETIIHGVDMSGKSLEIARKKTTGNENVLFFQSSVTDLDGLGLQKGSYSLVTCCSALVLLGEGNDLTPIIRSWAKYLKPGGVFVVDVPAADTQVVTESLSEATMFKPSLPRTRRSWIKSEASFVDIIEKSGLLRTARIWKSEVYKTADFTKKDVEERWNRELKSPIPNLDVLTDEERVMAGGNFRRIIEEKADADGILRDKWQLYIYIGIALDN